MSEHPLQRLARIIGYPVDEVHADARRHAFSVDGYEVEAEVVGQGEGQGEGLIRLSMKLEVTDEHSVDLVKYAAGRMLKESATLAYDSEKKWIFLWDEMDADVGDAELKSFFGAFLDSCDWWRARVKELEEKPMKVDEMVIMP